MHRMQEREHRVSYFTKAASYTTCLSYLPLTASCVSLTSSGFGESTHLHLRGCTDTPGEVPRAHPLWLWHPGLHLESARTPPFSCYLAWRHGGEV